MSELALIDAFAYVAGHDFTADTNQLALNGQAAQLDATTFGSGGWNENAYGLKSYDFAMQGWWQSAASDSVDDESFGDFNISRSHTFGPLEVETSPAYIFNAAKSNYKLLDGGVGALAGFSLASAGQDAFGVVRGQLAKAKGAMNAVGALGSGVQLGAVPAGQYLYATLHVFTAATTATVQVQSATANTFAGATTRGTIGPVTARGATWMTRVAGPITDTWFRFNVSAITGAFVAAGAIAIGK